MAETGQSTLPTSGFEDFRERSVSIMRDFENPSEVDTQVKVITPLLEQLGWDRFSPHMRFEYSLVEDIDKRPDYLLLNSSNQPRIVVEAKAWETEFTRREVNQLKMYMRSYNLKLGILTNGFNYHFYFRPDTQTLTISSPIRRTLHTLSLDDNFMSYFKPKGSTELSKEREDGAPGCTSPTPLRFYNNFLERSTGSRIPKQMVWEIYSNYAAKHGGTIVTCGEFWKRLYRYGVSKNAIKYLRTSNLESNRTQTLVGFRFTDEATQFMDPTHKRHPWIEQDI